ncbi:IclR family transcriptional regulator [Brevibacterium luteolum]|uniref:IclR family transcriptional regulator n=1 Tax=Brevibacterium luteolum TaxID=199591 RepID=A0A849AWD1_9MICO|nr:IclR family transcriptional regulator [Brevibacterium luteolum]MBM7530141.1 DNA-binding IclR family transcriptional regulator [Brevibacterium luteolum]NNG80112.1 IclR family transcriptional regulator [Brevibacterium luteolum]
MNSTDSSVADSRAFEPGADSALVRGLRVLTHVAEGGEVSAQDVSAELGLPLSTTYRYLKTLTDFDLIEKQHGRFVPGWRLSAWSGQDITRTRLIEVGHSFLQGLTNRTGKVSVLTVRAGHNAVCLRQVSPSADTGISFRINQVLPIYRGAGQRVLLAYAPPAVIEGALRAVSADAAADHAALARRQHLIADLKDIRARGVAVSHGELIDNAIAVAAPVRVGGEVICSLAVAGQADRVPANLVKSLTPVLTSAAAELGAELST